MKNLIQEIDGELKEITSKMNYSRVVEAMNYSLFAGGKRVRPILFLKTIASYQKDYTKYIDIACAIEMIHTYSLIHDDLPGMDNDEMRRGKATCHIAFDEATAILAGDALLTEALNVIIENKVVSETIKLKLIQCLYCASGVNGMILGQQLDMEAEKKQVDLKQLERIHLHKTGDLISAAFMMASIICDQKNISIWQDLGIKLGLMFQVQDDVLDVTSESEILGKNVNSDIVNQKSTYVSLLGLDESQKIITSLYGEIITKVNTLDIDHKLMLDFFEIILKRVN